MPSPLLAPLIAFARRLRYPTLFKITAALFALTLVVPDPLPFVDELLLGLGTLLLATWKNRDRRPDTTDVLEGEARREDRH
jgi:lauroyl/myristoyl acyltransferase